MDTIAISDLRENLPKIIDDVANYMKRLVISVSGKPKAVVMSLEELESLEETAEILSIPGAYKKIMKGLQEAKKGKGTLFTKMKT